MAQTVICMKGITKRFPGVLANDHVDLEIQPGKIHALLGENGAGKTTLMNVLSGRCRPDQGEIFIDGQEVQFNSPRDALQCGIGMVHQHFMLVSNQTVAENITLGVRSPHFLLRRTKIEQEIERLAKSFGLLIDPKAYAGELSLGQQQRIEILKLLHQNADVLILDEPTAVLSPSEIEELSKTLKNLARGGKSVIFITHKLEEVMEIADKITILRKGRVIANLTPEEVESRRELARLMVGREVVLQVERKPVTPGEVVLELRDCSGFDNRGHQAFQHITFAVRRGEIFSIVGVAGNGQAELVEAIIGLRPLSDGHILVLGKFLDRKDSLAKEAIGYIPEDRLGLGSVPNLNLVDNLILTSYASFYQKGIFQKETAHAKVEHLLSQYHVVTPSVETKARHLSGGNLQKLILARELSKKPRLLIAEQPTHGLDIGATEEVWTELLRQRETAGILLVSGDLREVLSLSDRIAVIFRGRLMGILTVEEEEYIGEIGPMMAGVRQKEKG